MPIVWTAYHGKPDFDLLATLEDVLSNWTDVVADETHALISTNEASVDFRGEIEIGMPNEPVGGTVHTIGILVGDTLIAKATGFDLDIDDIGDAFDAAEIGDFSLFEALFFEVPLTFNGSDEDDTFVDGDFGSLLKGNDGNDWLEGNGGADDIFGGKGADVVFGGAGNDEMRGNKGGDVLFGISGADTVIGGGGDDILGGGAGSILTGGKGEDTFGLGDDGVVEVTDFRVAKDRFLLDPEAFDVTEGDRLPEEEFHIGANAHDASDRIIYNENSGALFYDADGDGGGAKVKLAELDAGLNLSADHFFAGGIVI